MPPTDQTDQTMSNSQTVNHLPALLLALAVIVLAIIFLGQKYIQRAEPPPMVDLARPLTVEEQAAILRSLAAAPAPPLSAAEKSQIAKSLEYSAPSPMSREEQLKVLESLNKK